MGFLERLTGKYLLNISATMKPFAASLWHGVGWVIVCVCQRHSGLLVYVKVF